MTREDILKRLMNGEDSMVIAQELMDALNGAVGDYEAKVKAEEEKRKAEEAEKAKAKRVDELAEKATVALNALIQEMVPEFGDAVTADMLKDALTSSAALIKEVEKVFPMFEKTKVERSDKPACAGKRSKVTTLDELCEEDVDDIVKSFCEDDVDAIVKSFCNGFNF